MNAVDVFGGNVEPDDVNRFGFERFVAGSMFAGRPCWWVLAGLGEHDDDDESERRDVLGLIVSDGAGGWFGYDVDGLVAADAVQGDGKGSPLGWFDDAREAAFEIYLNGDAR